MGLPGETQIKAPPAKRLLKWIVPSMTPLTRQWAGTSSAALTTTICISLGDTLASLHGTIAILAAINHVRNTGVGQHIDMAMLNALHATDDFANMILDDTWTEDQQLNRCRIWDAPGLTKIAIAGAFPVIWKALLRDEALVDPASEGQSKSEKKALKEFLLSREVCRALHILR